MSKSTANILSAMNAMRDQKRDGFPHQLFMGILMMLFFVMLLIALGIGVTVYKQVADIQQETSNDRLGLQLIANNVRANDGTNTVMMGTGPEGRSLVLLERLESGTYETRIYLFDNSIVEEYAIAGAPYTPGKAVKLVDSSRFSFSYEDGLLTIVTDQGTTNVALRAVQGGA